MPWLFAGKGHEDMAAIQLRKILSQNTKLIKGYHLLALIYMKNHDWGKARRTLRKAARIDKTNTTTLRFLREVDERTGVTTRLEKQKKGLFGAKGKHDRSEEDFQKCGGTAGCLQGEFQTFPVCNTYGWCGCGSGCILASGSSCHQAGNLPGGQPADREVQRIFGKPGSRAFQSPGRSQGIWGCG